MSHSVIPAMDVEHGFVDELLQAIENREADIGGSRPTAEIIKDLGAAWQAVEDAIGAATREGHAIDKDRWCIVRESVLDIGLGGDVRTGGKPELGYALLADATTFESEEAAHAAIKEADLPLGWVLMPLSRLLPDVFAPEGGQK